MKLRAYCHPRQRGNGSLSAIRKPGDEAKRRTNRPPSKIRWGGAGLSVVFVFRCVGCGKVPYLPTWPTTTKHVSRNLSRPEGLRTRGVYGDIGTSPL